MQKSLRCGFGFIIKSLTVIFSLGGVILSLINAEVDGYNSWFARTLYFTAQSNIWIGLNTLTIIIVDWFFPRARRFKDKLYFFKFSFAVSITITALIFFCFLAPFADESYHVWTLSSFYTHLFAPVLAVIDYFFDDYPFYLTKKQKFMAIVPSAIWVFITSILCILGVDYGRGDKYPYFFFNFFSPAGVFGFSSIPPFFMGSFYWIIGIGLTIFLIGLFYARIKNAQRKR